MKTAFLNFNVCKSNEPTEENFNAIGINSGNIVFSKSLAETIRCESVTSSEFIERANEFDNLVIRHLITIKEENDLSHLSKVLQLFKDKPIIPISFGLQSSTMKSDFKLHPQAEKILKEMSERAVLGIRGYYSAAILEKHGIKNIRVIGCPSLYLGANITER